MANPFLLLSGIGMFLVGLLAIIYWRRKTGAQWKYFGWGAIAWVLAIAVKIVMDLTISGALNAAAYQAGFWVLIAVSVLYLGLRTGFLESGFSYVLIKKKLGKLDWKSAVAFGIGFGAIEAIFVGLSSFLNILLFILSPELITTLPPDLQAAVQAQLSLDTLYVIPSIVERLAAMFVHVFAGALVAFAVNSRKIRYFWCSLIYKSVLDGMVPLLLVFIGTATTLAAFMVEVPIVAMGVIGYLGLRWLKPKFAKAK